MLLAGLLIAAAVSYGLAAAGEPSAVWLWRDVLSGAAEIDNV